MCRKPKYFVYWLTTTTISTSTSLFYTTTVSFISLNCTPTYFPWAFCG
jgi:hypothetical protein